MVIFGEQIIGTDIGKVLSLIRDDAKVREARYSVLKGSKDLLQHFRAGQIVSTHVFGEQLEVPGPLREKAINGAFVLADFHPNTRQGFLFQSRYRITVHRPADDQHGDERGAEQGHNNAVP